MEKQFKHLIKEVKPTKRKLKMFFRKSFRIIQDLINKELQEEDSLIPSGSKALSLQVPEKRKLLKKIYKEVLKKMGEESNIKAFLKLIDVVPESYLDYELQINTPQAGKFVEDLIKGKEQISMEELENLINVVKGVGAPAIINYATEKSKLEKKTAKFGAEEINRNTKEYLDSKRARYSGKNQLSGPENKSIIKKENSKAIAKIKRELVSSLQATDLDKIQETPLGKLLDQIKGSKINIGERLPDLSEVIKKSKNYKEANSLFSSKGMNIEFKNENEFDTFLKSLHKETKKEKVYAKR